MIKENIIINLGSLFFTSSLNELGEIQNKGIMVQLKSTDNIQLSIPKQGFIVDLSKRDLELWLKSHYPVLLVLYDAQKEVAYFTDLQRYFNENRISSKNVLKFVRVFLPSQSVFDTKTIHDLQIK